MFIELSNIYVEFTLYEPIEEYYYIEIILDPTSSGLIREYDDIEIVLEPPQEDIPDNLNPNDYPSTESEDMLNDTTFIEWLEASSFIVEEA